MPAHSLTISSLGYQCQLAAGACSRRGPRRVAHMHGWAPGQTLRTCHVVWRSPCVVLPVSLDCPFKAAWLPHLSSPAPSPNVTPPLLPPDRAAQVWDVRRTHHLRQLHRRPMRPVLLPRVLHGHRPRSCEPGWHVPSECSIPPHAATGWLASKQVTCTGATAINGWLGV